MNSTFPGTIPLIRDRVFLWMRGFFQSVLLPV
jgi:hypothetical protein